MLWALLACTATIAIGLFVTTRIRRAGNTFDRASPSANVRGAGQHGAPTDPRNSRRGAPVEQLLHKIVKLIRYGAGKGVLLPPEERFFGSALGGFIAGMCAVADDGLPLADLLATATSSVSPCRAMAKETSAIFASVCATDAEKSTDPILTVLGILCEHPALSQLRHLFRIMPMEAAELASATGFLLSLTIQQHAPALGAKILKARAAEEAA